jgi:hypothetical protein
MTIMDDPYSILESLRYAVNMKVFSPDEPGVLIWLKKIEEGITHCCYADDPCEYHKQIQNNMNKSLKN